VKWLAINENEDLCRRTRSLLAPSTMTTTHAYYLLAYHHPSIRPLDRIERLKLDSDADGREMVLALPKDDDLKDATIWKVSRLAVAQLPL
jgi:hypothetical protein